jgi:hypothetical protein
MPVVTLSDLEAQAFPIDDQELSNIIWHTKEFLNQEIEKFQKIKKELFSRNQGAVHSWPESEQQKLLEEITKIDAITAEAINYIERLTSEATQISI